MYDNIYALRASVSKSLAAYNYDQNDSANYDYDSLREESRKELACEMNTDTEQT
jgi:hypothetical protein